MRIKSLSIFTNQLEAQYSFYVQQLGFACINKDQSSFTVNIGNSQLSFIKKEHCTPYHFAFNIPYSSVQKALEWLKQKVSVLMDGTNKIQEFETWQANAIYFYDEDKNIVELIGRKTLGYDSGNTFNTSEVKEISEIGIASSNIEDIYNTITSTTPLKIYDGDFSRFCAIGNETGLFICVNPEEKKWFPTNDSVFFSDFKVIISNHGADHEVKYEKGKLLLS